MARGHAAPAPRARRATGALICSVVLVNTGYLGIPLSAALLGSDALDEAIAWDTLVSGPMLFVVGFAARRGVRHARRTRAPASACARS